MQRNSRYSAHQCKEVARHYIRHPTDIPIEVIPENNLPTLTDNLNNALQVERMENVSFGGLMFQSAIPYAQNKCMLVKIKSTSPEFEGHAVVSWCRKTGKNYLVGLEFTDKDSEFKVHMVEQVCHIIHYRKQVLEMEGRKIGNDEAAKEWIAQYAADFKKL